MTSEAYRSLSNALDLALTRHPSHWVSAKMSAPVVLEDGHEIAPPPSAEVSQESLPGEAEVPAVEEPSRLETSGEEPLTVADKTDHIESSASHPQRAAEPAQEMPRFLRDTLDLEDATASLRLLRQLSSALDAQQSEIHSIITQPDVPLAPTPAAPEKRHFKYWPEAALTSAALICLGVFFWLDRGPSSLTSSDFSNSKRSGSVSRLNFVGLGGCIGKACETLVTIKPIPAAGTSKEPAGPVVPEGPLDAATAPAGVIVSTASEEISSHDESAQPAMMEHAIRLGVPEETVTAPPAETETAPELVHNLDTELLDPATPSPPPDASQAVAEPPSKPKQTTIKPKAPRRQGVAQPALKPAAKSAKQAAPKRGLAEANQEKTPPVQKAAPGSKPSAPVVATAKPADETVQNTYDDPPPGFQILNNLNNEFFSFQP